MTKQTAKINANRIRRQIRIRTKIHGTAVRPRLAVNRSLRYLSAQVIDDQIGKTLVGLTEQKMKLKGTKTARAEEFAVRLAAELQKKNITAIVFDKRHYLYHGRIKIFADSLRKQGIQF
ncbi:MAG: 50S ribosomal protein L18 [Candidatus Komeilibacteria bacterium CG_4_10_14_0_2_um_filter_37_10]|uniref:Large ribosomal subunit protein uL18 n=1 Tax=Candidatus Komeilibacteria bacterium CG_4_10_14_0_2_um_filter_37_10 TaxID=1974470 RepID=A0A2M7VGG7_9BACT|nr:MAG: 50S ribosomal protein L18 [Candidatus Komeilibacteria bacterium CG_4_10_14_0_2_um_filter_37_10]